MDDTRRSPTFAAHRPHFFCVERRYVCMHHWGHRIRTKAGKSSIDGLETDAVATLADVGISKVQCIRRRSIAIALWAKSDLQQEKFDEDVAEGLLSPWGVDEDGWAPDYILHAIDNIDTKIALLKFCHDKGLPLISSIGAAVRVWNRPSLT
ncbi:hypothetical protein BKA56DRAFT_689419 [Ilyonectria sp. MPI-CAGE-AT-0026]|nr:hypothetical protein BKA56DRAFT_689419 [Ilyonectria sp. MPI-CAGE-AT-0026]